MLADKLFYDFLSRLLPFLKTGLNLHQALPLLDKAFFSQNQRLKRLQALLQQGYRFSVCLEIEKAPPSLLAWIQMGERTGQITLAIESALTLHTFQKKYQKTLAEVLRYPITLFVLTCAALWFLEGSFFSSFKKLYGHQSLPWFSEYLFNHPYVLALIPFLLFLGLGGFFLSFKNLQRKLARAKQIEIQLLAEVPLLEAAPLSWIPFLKQSYPLSVICEVLQEDSFLIQKIQIAEKLGHYAYAFQEARLFYEEQLKNRLDRFRYYLPIFMTLVLGALIGSMVLSVYLPMLNLNPEIF